MCWARTINKSQSESDSSCYCYFCCIVEFCSYLTEYLTDVFVDKMESLIYKNSTQHVQMIHDVSIHGYCSVHSHMHKHRVKFCLFYDSIRYRCKILCSQHEWSKHIIRNFELFLYGRWNVRVHQFLKANTNKLNFSVVSCKQRILYA